MRNLNRFSALLDLQVPSAVGLLARRRLVVRELNPPGDAAGIYSTTLAPAAREVPTLPLPLLRSPVACKVPYHPLPPRASVYMHLPTPRN